MSNNNIECKLKSLNLCKIFNLKNIQEERLTFLNLSVKSDVPSSVNTNLNIFSSFCNLGGWAVFIGVDSLWVSILFDDIKINVRVD